VIPHIKPATLVALELGLLDPGEREAADRHLTGCRSCDERLEEIRAGIRSMAAEVRSAVDEGAHVPSVLLSEFCAAPSALGAETAAAVEAHVERCERCAGEVARARAAAETAWVARAAPTRRAARPARSWSLWPSLGWRPAVALAAAALALAVGLPRWFATRESPGLAVGTPLRLLGVRDAAAPAPAVAVAPDHPLVLFIKLAAPPDPAARYELVLEGASGARHRRAIAGSTFDRSGTVGVLLEPDAFADGERVEVRIVRAGEAGPPVFNDAFTVQRVGAAP
jgi:hypothetical protein